MIVLGIETTCDETACAIVRDGREILANIVSTQIDLHREYGGVVPELACRRHVDVLIPVLEEAVQKSGCRLQDIALISVARGPGLIGPLLVGIHAAEALSWVLKKPLVGINHIEAHLYAALMSSEQEIIFPCLGVVLSGGHTAIVLMREIGDYQLIGETVDDAVGEAFDKVAKIIDLPYPGGPQIEALAKQASASRFSLKAGVVKGYPFHFSFSGLKTAVLYAAKGRRAAQDSPLIISEEEKKTLAASFQETAFSDIVSKVLKAAEEYSVPTIVFGGGVTCNQKIREMFKQKNPSLHYVWPSLALSLDNAAMIAGLAFHQFKKQGKGDKSIEAATTISW